MAAASIAAFRPRLGPVLYDRDPRRRPRRRAEALTSTTTATMTRPSTSNAIPGRAASTSSFDERRPPRATGDRGTHVRGRTTRDKESRSRSTVGSDVCVSLRLRQPQRLGSRSRSSSSCRLRTAPRSRHTRARRRKPSTHAQQHVVGARHLATKKRSRIDRLQIGAPSRAALVEGERENRAGCETARAAAVPAPGTRDFLIRPRG